MPLPLAAGGAYMVGMQQSVPAGSKFNGKKPTSEPYIQNGLNKYEPGTDAGLFFFGNHKPLAAPHYNIDFGAPVDYEVAVVSMDPKGETIYDRVVIEMGNARLVDGADHYGFTLGPYQAFEVKVTGAAPGTTMIANFWVMDGTAFFA